MKKVLVLLGDPRLSDPVKNFGKFNKEDFEKFWKTFKEEVKN